MPGKPDESLAVLIGDARVGTLAETPDGLVAFQYDSGWLRGGYSINPYSLPLSDELFVPKWHPFDGLFGAFNDSLPDGWGALLLDRMLAEAGIDPALVGPLERLSIVGSNGRGALRYEPEAGFPLKLQSSDLDELAQLCSDILMNKPVADLDAVYAAGGSSGGARPKAYVEDEDGAWLVKFPARMDPLEAGSLEYDYMACASECGIQVPEFKLFPSELCGGYFATKRFDVRDGRRVHMLTASGIVEVSHREPVLNYKSLFQISYFLTGSRAEAEQLFRLMCFNVFARNYDDHANNFTWLCEQGEWKLSPAYDLTYSAGFHRGHMTSVRGSGEPTMDDVLALAKEVGLPAAASKRVALDIRDACGDLLARHGLSHS